RQAVRAQVGQRGGLQSLVAIGHVVEGDAAFGGGAGEFGHSRNRRRLLFGHPVGPGVVIVFEAVPNQAGLVGRVVEHRLVDVQDHRRRQVVPGTGVVALGGDERVPVRVGQGGIELGNGATVQGHQGGGVLVRSLHPQHRVEVVVRGVRCRQGGGRLGCSGGRGGAAGEGE